MGKLTRAEKKLISEFVREQKKIRKVPPHYEKEDMFEDLLEHIREEILFHAMDFIKENKFHEDKEKLKTVWEYMRKKLK